MIGPRRNGGQSTLGRNGDGRLAGAVVSPHHHRAVVLQGYCVIGSRTNGYHSALRRGGYRRLAGAILPPRPYRVGYWRLGGADSRPGAEDEEQREETVLHRSISQFCPFTPFLRRSSEKVTGNVEEVFAGDGRGGE